MAGTYGAAGEKYGSAIGTYGALGGANAQSAPTVTAKDSSTSAVTAAASSAATVTD